MIVIRVNDWQIIFTYSIIPGSQICIVEVCAVGLPPKFSSLFLQTRVIEKQFFFLFQFRDFCHRDSQKLSLMFAPCRGLKIGNILKRKIVVATIQIPTSYIAFNFSSNYFHNCRPIKKHYFIQNINEESSWILHFYIRN